MNLGQLAHQAIELTRTDVFDATQGNFDGRAVLLFSGGRDSSAVAACFCCAFPAGQLYLLRIDNGLLSRLDSTVRQVNLLRHLFPGTDIVFETKQVSEMMRRVGMQAVEKDFTEHGYSTLLVCLACKIIMSVCAARFARGIGTQLVLDGSAIRQRNYPEQSDEFVEIIRGFYHDAGMIYLSPLYELLTSVDLTNQLLAELGVYIPKQEPICMWSDSFSAADPNEVKRYTEEKLRKALQLEAILGAVAEQGGGVLASDPPVPDHADQWPERSAPGQVRPRGPTPGSGDRSGLADTCPADGARALRWS